MSRKWKTYHYQCKYCLNNFESPRILTKFHRFCSNDCKIAYKEKTKQIITCKTCGDLFEVSESQIQFRQYCSTECQVSFHKKKYEEDRKQTFFQIFSRDKFCCIYCGKSSIVDGVKLHLDHIYPRSKKGTNKLFNLVTSCENCNLSKSKTIVSPDLILEIWEEVERRNKNSFTIKKYKELEDIFNKTYLKEK